MLLKNGIGVYEKITEQEDAMSQLSHITNVSNKSYQRLSSGKRINVAADGAAELAISEGMNSRTNGYNVGANNINNARNLLNISDGALGSIHDSLQRIRELAVEASNGTLTSSDREALQWEVDQLKDEISSVAKNTNYNTKNLLDGSESELSIEMGGAKKNISLTNASLEALGIKDFDVTGKFNLKDIDDAIKKVSSARSKAGAQYNALEHAYNYNRNASENLTRANSNLIDLDYGKEVTEKNKQNILQQYALFAQRQKMEQNKNKLNILN